MFLEIKLPTPPKADKLVIECDYSLDFNGGWVAFHTTDPECIDLVTTMSKGYGLLYHSDALIETYKLQVYKVYKAKEIANYIQDLFDISEALNKLF